MLISEWGFMNPKPTSDYATVCDHFCEVYMTKTTAAISKIYCNGHGLDNCLKKSVF